MVVVDDSVAVVVAVVVVFVVICVNCYFLYGCRFIYKMVPQIVYLRLHLCLYLEKK